MTQSPPSPTELLANAREALRAGGVSKAIPLFQAAVQVPGATAAEFLELADALWANLQFEDAVRAYEGAAERDPANDAPLLLAAKRLFGLARFADSARFLGKALQRRPDDTSTQRMLAEVLDRQGRRVEAETLARKAFSQNPNDARAARALGHILRTSGRVAEAAELLARHIGDHSGPDNWRVNQELAACLDGLGDYTGAMSALLAAKAQLHPAAQPLLQRWRERAIRREQFARALNAGTLQQWAQITSKVRQACPIAILAGHPRSGTTLLEQMLAAHSRIVTTDETGILRTQFIESIVLNADSTDMALKEVNEFDRDQIESGRGFYFRATEAHIGEPLAGRLVVEKDPLATCDLGFMLRLLPESRVIFPLRDPRDVCVSYFFTLVPLNADSSPALDLASTCEAMALTLRLWKHWREIIPQRWIEVRYEQLVQEPRRELTPLTETLDLPWEEQMLAPHARQSSRGVRTPTYADVAKPLYTRSIGRWNHYASWLEPRLGALKSLLKEFGYA